MRSNKQWYEAQSFDVQKMVRSIRRQLTLSELSDVASHGADSGWAGFTYTSDCVKFYNRHESAIWEMLSDMAESMGENIPQLIAGFGRVDMAFSVDISISLSDYTGRQNVNRLTEVSIPVCR